MLIHEQDLNSGQSLGSKPRKFPEGSSFRQHPEHAYQGQAENPRRCPFSLILGTIRNVDPDFIDAEYKRGELSERSRIGHIV